MRKHTVTRAMLACALTCALSVTPAYAAEMPDNHPGTHGTKQDAYVSEEKDETSTQDAGMSTDVYMYIEKDPEKPEEPSTPVVNQDVPKMGDTGIDQTVLFEAALLAGACFLVSNAAANAIAERKREEQCAAS